MQHARHHAHCATRNVKYASSRTIQEVIASYRRGPILFLIRAVIGISNAGFLIVQRSFWTPDVLLLIVLFVGLVYGRGREFTFRFVPFLGMLFVYDSMRSFAPKLNTYVNFWPMIHFDRFFGGGQIIASRLQQLLWQGHAIWHDFYFCTLYTLHFVMPLVLGLVLWKWRPRYYWPFVLTVVGVSFLAFVIYVAFPAAPPWMAARDGYPNEPFVHTSAYVWWQMGIKNFTQVYAQLSPNPVAAVPSLHSAYPLIAAIFTLLAFGWRKAWWIIIYPLSMWIGVMYLGEHYLFDIVAAILDVAIVMWAVRWFFRRWRSNDRHFRHIKRTYYGALHHLQIT